MTTTTGSPHYARWMPLDPNDPRPPYIQVASHLRAAILTGKYRPGERLPSGSELAELYGVSRQTVQQALRPLRDEGLIVGRQGAGTYVRAKTERAVGLRPHIERAFEAAHVTIDFAGFTGETLAGALQEPLDKIREGRLTPQTINLRILAPDTEVPWILPRRADTGEDSPEFRQRQRDIASRSLGGIRHSIEELDELGLISAGTVQIRTHRAVPLFKLYILNREEVFFGLYPITKHDVRLGNSTAPIWDLGGKDTTLFHQDANADETGAAFVEQAQQWFDTWWTNIAEEPG